MRFLADMGVSVRVADWLRSQGHDVAHLSVQGLHRISDEAVFAKAGEEERIVLTFDLGFGEIIARAHGRSTSVILFRVNDTSSSHVTRRLNRVFELSSDVLAEGAVIVVEDSRHRVRRFPLKSD